VAALAATHRPDEIQAYAVDLGGGLLHRLRDLPHVGAVCGPRDTERVRRLVRELRSLLVERERQFRDLGVDSMAAWHAVRRDGADLGGYGEVFLLVDNWGALVHELPELEAEIAELAALGLHYGVHLVLTANRWPEVRPGLRENLGGRLELRLNDPLESEVGRTAAAALPELPGRGLTQSGLQFQTALPGPAAAILDRALSNPGGGVAPPLRLLPTLIEETALRRVTPAGAGTADHGGAGLPFAVEEGRLEVVRLDLLRGSPHLLVFGDAGCGKSSLLRLIAKAVAARYPAEAVGLVVLDLRRGLSDLMALPNLVGYASTTTAVVQVVDRLRRQLEDRSAASPDPFAAPELVGWPALLGGPAGGAALGGGPAMEGGPALAGRRAGGAGLRTHTASNGSHTPTGSPPSELRSSESFSVEPRPAESHSADPSALQRRWLLLVDDYDLLPATGGSLLLPLLDLLGLGRELGLHLVLARRVAGAARAGFEPVVQRLRELGGPGLVMCGDPSEGPVIGGQRAAVLPPGRGFYVCPPRATTLVQVASCPPSAAGRPPRLGGGQIRRPGP
jgi:hypothetical protein